MMHVSKVRKQRNSSMVWKVAIIVVQPEMCNPPHAFLAPFHESFSGSGWIFSCLFIAYLPTTFFYSGVGNVITEVTANVIGLQNALKYLSSWTNKQTNKQTNIQTSKQASKQTNRQTDRQTNRQTDRQTNTLLQIGFPRRCDSDVSSTLSPIIMVQPKISPCKTSFRWNRMFSASMIVRGGVIKCYRIPSWSSLSEQME